MILPVLLENPEEQRDQKVISEVKLQSELLSINKKSWGYSRSFLSSSDLTPLEKEKKILER